MDLNRFHCGNFLLTQKSIEIVSVTGKDVDSRHQGREIESQRSVHMRLFNVQHRCGTETRCSSYKGDENTARKSENSVPGGPQKTGDFRSGKSDFHKEAWVNKLYSTYSHRFGSCRWARALYYGKLAWTSPTYPSTSRPQDEVSSLCCCSSTGLYADPLNSHRKVRWNAVFLGWGIVVLRCSFFCPVRSSPSRFFGFPPKKACRPSPR